MTYHYTESGLDNVYLIDGYTVHKTPYGKGVSIQNTEGLHRAIGKWLIAQPRPLNGAELRFIRTEMELTQRALAGIIGAEEQTLRLWEKKRDKFMPATAERLLRALYSEALGNNVQIKRMLEKLADLDRVEGGKACFTKKNGWKPLKAPDLERAHG
jgi:DNA-binding transcriptional regulator YiaG